MKTELLTEATREKVRAIIEFQSFFLSEKIKFLNEVKAVLEGYKSIYSKSINAMLAFIAFIINTKQSSDELDHGT